MTFAEERESEADLKETTKETVVEVAKQQSKSKSQVKGKCKRLNDCFFNLSASFLLHDSLTKYRVLVF